MDCRVAHNLMQLELDGELAASEHEQLQAHCSECPACRERREQLGMVRGALRGLATMTAPPAEGAPLVFSPPTAPRRWWPALMATAAAIALLIGGYVMLSPPRGPQHFASPLVRATAPSPSVTEKGLPSPHEKPSLALRARNEDNSSRVRTEVPSHALATRDAQVRRANVEIEDPNVIAVPYRTRNPKVTIIWIYPKVELAATAADSGRQPS
jgi:hypothetical protein